VRARRVRLHDREPAKRHAQRVVREHGTDARLKAGEERRGAGEVVVAVVRCVEHHNA
jgi:hypothetical protein